MKEQIIEEMAKEMCEVCYSKPFCKVISAHCPIAIRDAERLYNAGYRKQKEGEWIKHFASYECTVCKQEFCVSEYAEDYDPIEDYDLHFCPNCGAKMKGENNE